MLGLPCQILAPPINARGAAPLMRGTRTLQYGLGNTFEKMELGQTGGWVVDAVDNVHGDININFA